MKAPNVFTRRVMQDTLDIQEYVDSEGIFEGDSITHRR